MSISTAGTFSSLFSPVKVQWQERKETIVFWHILVWVVVLSLPYLLRLVYDQNTRENPLAKGFFYLSLTTNILWVIAFYVNAFLLIPRFLYKKKPGLFIVSLVGMFGIFMGIHGIFFKQFISGRPFVFLFSAAFNAPAYLLSIASSTLYRFYTERAEIKRKEQQKQEENLKTELSFLRSQISPHFIFNVLNNIVALARLKSDQLEPTVMRLASLMQYMLYDTNEDRVALQTETDYLTSYIDLQRQRFGSNVDIRVHLVPEGNYEIEPMLLIPFVENAFKHGVGLIEKPQIKIFLETKDGKLYFKVKNKYNAAVPEQKDKASGIGLNNVKRRLDLLYSNEHVLNISNYNAENADWFEVYLQLNLH